MEIVGTGDWAKAWESFSRIQPNHFFHICTWSPSTEARVSRVYSFHFHQWLAYNCQDQTFPSDFTTEVRRLSHSVYSYGRAQENWGICKNTGWRISRITFPFIFPQDKRTAQDTVICQTPKQNKTGLLLIQTNGHSCRKVSTWNLTVLNSRFAVLWSLFQDSFSPQCLFMLTICSMWQDLFYYMYFWQHCIPYFPFSTFGWHSPNLPSIQLFCHQLMQWSLKPRLSYSSTVGQVCWEFSKCLTLFWLSWIVWAGLNCCESEKARPRELAFDHLRLRLKHQAKLRESKTNSKQKALCDISVIETDELYIFTVDA